jgi:hypothetical protein
VSTKEKLIKRFLALPKDFTFDELVKLLTALGFSMSNKGKTSGSRVKFTNPQQAISVDFHKPHQQGSPIKETALKKIYTNLVTGRFLMLYPKKNRRRNR